jgi:uncharacterized protein involved in exopolysaccharide biosynthesis
MIIEDTNNIKPNPSDEISIVDLISKVKEITKYLKSKWIIILSFSLLGALLGLGYSIFKKPTYTAICTFVLEDAKGGGGLGQYAGLASLAGINLGGSGGGIFEGDNIIELYKSRTMIEKALLSDAINNGKKEPLINSFIEAYNLRAKWISENLGSNIDFVANQQNFTRVQDSLISDIVDLFNKKLLTVIKPDKKLNIISVQVETKNEFFSKNFTEKLVQTVNDFYIYTKTKKTSQNVQILQHQADSVKQSLNTSLSGVASAIDADPNANPQLISLKVSAQKRQIDVQAATAVYGEIVKNLELAKISFRQETPLIQVVDYPILPLKCNYINKLKGLIVGFLSALVVAILTLSIMMNVNKTANS